MVSRRETVEIVDKLIELTQHNNVVWESSKPPDNLTGTDVRIDLVYTAFHLNKHIRIYQKEYKLFMGKSRQNWDSEVVFEFIDPSGHSLLQFPETNNVVNLFNAVQYQNSKVSDFYKDLVGK